MQRNCLLYIDPGTGSMLFSVLLGIFMAALFAFRKAWIKIKSLVLGGRVEKINKDKIPVVIFTDSKRYWTIFHPICDELDRRGIRTEYWTESEDDPAFGSEKDYKNITCRYIGNLNKAITKLNIMNAYICLSTTPGLEVYQWKKSKNTDLYIHIWHSVSSGLLYRMFGTDWYDVLMLPGDFIEENLRKLEKMRHMPPKIMLKTGLPYFDVMAQKVGSMTFDRADTTTVLVAPTWGVNSLFNQLGDELLDRLIATGYNIIVRPHPQSYTAEADLIDRLKRKYPENDHFHWNADNDNLSVLGSSDIMISDHSAVVYDYAIIFDKPVIYSLVEFVKDPYDAWFIDEDPRIITILPEMAHELKKEDLPDIKKIIDEALADTEKARGRAYAREHFWYNHGEGANKCVDYIEETLKDLQDRSRSLPEEEKAG